MDSFYANADLQPSASMSKRRKMTTSLDRNWNLHFLYCSIVIRLQEIDSVLQYIERPVDSTFVRFIYVYGIWITCD